MPGTWKVLRSWLTVKHHQISKLEDLTANGWPYFLLFRIFQAPRGIFGAWSSACPYPQQFPSIGSWAPLTSYHQCSLPVAWRHPQPSDHSWRAVLTTYYHLLGIKNPCTKSTHIPPPRSSSLANKLWVITGPLVVLRVVQKVLALKSARRPIWAWLCHHVICSENRWASLSQILKTWLGLLPERSWQRRPCVSSEPAMTKRLGHPVNSRERDFLREYLLITAH